MTTYNLYLDFESREYKIEANSPEDLAETFVIMF